MSNKSQISLEKPTLKKGCQGQTVKELQHILALWKVYSGSLNGIFDQCVENSVKAFQHRMFLEENGIVDCLTWKVLYAGAPIQMPELALGDCNESVEILQTLLRQLDYFNAEIDGKFGEKTHFAVCVLQRQHYLQTDGIVTDRIWYLLSKIPH
jgi:peptidoglycan hydrolase-like protein with peptidoglycan-binding domain